VAAPPAVKALRSSLALRLTRLGLAFECAHVMVSPDLIRGVLTVRNVGREPVAFVDHGNSWGAYQATFGGRGWSARNPVDTWRANFYTETVLTPGEVRHACFCIMRSVTAELIPRDDWCFVVSESLDLPSGAASLRASFDRGQTVALIMDGAGMSGLDAEYVQHKAPVWVGTASLLSEEMSSVQDLDRYMLGETLR
jgi:hypothetical protein